MLLDDKGRPLIEWGLEQARIREWPVHVILRQEKSNLIEFLKNYSYNISYQCVPETKDWPESLMLSEPYWHQKNIVWLPDTRFEPLEALDVINYQLESRKIVYGVFAVENSMMWGVVNEVKNSICEKCQISGPQKAWGLMGFFKSSGKELFEAHLKSTLQKKEVSVSEKILTVELEKFADLTR